MTATYTPFIAKFSCLNCGTCFGPQHVGREPHCCGRAVAPVVDMSELDAAAAAYDAELDEVEALDRAHERALREARPKTRRFEIPVTVAGRRTVLVTVRAADMKGATEAAHVECVRLGYGSFTVWTPPVC